MRSLRTWGVQFPNPPSLLNFIWGVSLLEKRATYNRLTAGALPPRPTICPNSSAG